MNHKPPFWQGYGEKYFITICCDDRGENVLCQERVKDVVFEAVEHYHKNRKWFCYLLILMPDHIHAIMSFELAGGMAEQIRNWKRYLSRQGIKFQRDFHDHRLRSEEQYILKADYIRMNPYRSGLCEEGEKWAYIWEPIE